MKAATFWKLNTLAFAATAAVASAIALSKDHPSRPLYVAANRQCLSVSGSAAPVLSARDRADEEQALVAELRQTTAPAATSALLDALAPIATERSLPMLGELVHSRSLDIAEQAIGVMGRVASDQAVAPL